MFINNSKYQNIKKPPLILRISMHFLYQNIKRFLLIIHISRHFQSNKRKHFSVNSIELLITWKYLPKFCYLYRLLSFLKQPRQVIYLSRLIKSNHCQRWKEVWSNSYIIFCSIIRLSNSPQRNLSICFTHQFEVFINVSAILF